jgi:hypothetical protein
MKEFQNELTQAFDESQQELAFYKARCEQDANTQLRSQMEDELRQRVAVLEMEKRRVEEDRDREVREIRDREIGTGRVWAWAGIGRYPGGVSRSQRPIIT